MPATAGSRKASARRRRIGSGSPPGSPTGRTSEGELVVWDAEAGCLSIEALQRRAATRRRRPRCPAYHCRLTTRSAWTDHDGGLPLIEGTLIRLLVDHLPGGGDPQPLWLWSSQTGRAGADVDLRRQAFLRRSTWNRSSG